MELADWWCFGKVELSFDFHAFRLQRGYADGFARRALTEPWASAAVSVKVYRVGVAVGQATIPTVVEQSKVEVVWLHLQIGRAHV